MEDQKNAAVVFGAILPHPPILIPEIGKKQLSKAEKSSQALSQFSKSYKNISCDTQIIITPHGLNGLASVPVYASHVFEGNFSAFGAGAVSFHVKGDPSLAIATVKGCDFASRCAETLLDHGVMVPLYFLQKTHTTPILPIAIGYLPLRRLYQFGQSLAKTAQRLGRKISVIASADMSHRLTPEAPGGFHPQGTIFDQKLVELVKNNAVEEILDFDPVLAEVAGQDALWSIAILLGALSETNLRPNLLSYEGPFGVGYMVASYSA